jgi:pSer/pThr/pTyr-binding forkhead associated (FHA) protein
MKLIMTSPFGNLKFKTIKSETTIGRSDTCDWIIPSDKLSRVHCIFYINKEIETMAIMDCGSKNGVMVDGVKIEPNQKVYLTTASLVMLANQYILSFGADKKVEMIDTSAHKEVAARSHEKKSPSKDDDDEDEELPFKEKLKKFLIFCMAVILILLAGVYFLMYR